MSFLIQNRKSIELTPLELAVKTLKRKSRLSTIQSPSFDFSWKGWVENQLCFRWWQKTYVIRPCHEPLPTTHPPTQSHCVALIRKYWNSSTNGQSGWFEQCRWIKGKRHALLGSKIVLWCHSTVQFLWVVTPLNCYLFLTAKMGLVTFQSFLQSPI